MAAPPTITALPAFPVRGEAQATFAAAANATVAAYPTMVTETNALATWSEDTAADVVVDAAAAAVSEVGATAAMTEAIAVAGTYTVINQGSWAVAPTTRNDGSALQVGDLYYNSVSEKMQIWSA